VQESFLQNDTSFPSHVESFAIGSIPLKEEEKEEGKEKVIIVRFHTSFCL